MFIRVTSLVATHAVLQTVCICYFSEGGAGEGRREGFHTWSHPVNLIVNTCAIVDFLCLPFYDQDDVEEEEETRDEGNRGIEGGNWS